MLNDPEKESRNEPVEVRCYFVRHRNALAVRSEFSTLFRDYYLHLMQHGIRHSRGHDELLKEALAALVLHLASRPRNESAAWTLSWQDPLFNLFVTGSNRGGNVTGRLFTEDVRERDRPLFFSQVTTDGQPARQSTIEAGTPRFFSLIEDFYRQSEQRPARFFQFAEEDFVMVTAQPGCDLAWFHDLTDESIRELDSSEELSLLEERFYSFDCGCSLFKLLPVIGSLSPGTRDEIFDNESNAANIQCPRCGAGFVLTRELLDQYQQKSGDPQ